MTSDEFASLNEKLDRLLAFQELLRPYLPMLARIADNPAARFMQRRQRTNV